MSAEMEFSWVEVPERSIIILRQEIPDWDERFDFLNTIKEHYPTCLIVLMDKESSLEVLPIETMRELLEDLIAHSEALEKTQ